jgi:anthranilate phosphoribosyltransferase
MGGIFHTAELTLGAWQQLWYAALRDEQTTAATFALLLAQAKAEHLDEQPEYVAALLEVFALFGAPPQGLKNIEELLHFNLATPQDWLLADSQAQTLTAEVVQLAVSFLLSAMGAPVLRSGDYGYGFSVGSSDILEYGGFIFAQNDDILGKQVRELGFGYLHLPHFYAPLQQLRAARAAFGGRSILDRLTPLLGSSDNNILLIACSGWVQARFYGHFLQPRREILYDQSGSPLISLCSDFYLQNSSEIEAMQLHDWALPRLNKNLLVGTKINTAAEGAQLLNDLLANKLGADWSNLLVANAAFLAQIAQPYRNINRSLLDAEAALAGRHALHTWEAACRKKA